MDNLIIRVLNGDASPFEVQRLNRWRDETPENEAHFRELSQLWELTGPEPRYAEATPPPVAEILKAADSLGPEVGLELGSSTSRPPPSSPRSARVTKTPTSWRSWGLLAASVAALALGVRVFGPGGPEPLAEYVTAPGETLTVTLNDGSFVRMAGDSRLQVWDETVRRDVSLRGKAFFAVTRDESRPFTVQTRHGDVRVLGTRFEVGGQGDGIRTVVVEGRVALSNESGSVEVTAGSLAYMSSGEAPATQEATDIWSLLDWPDGILVFQETPLQQVVEEVSRHFHLPLEITDTELGNRRITAWFQLESFLEVADALCAVVGASCDQKEPGVTISARADLGGTR